jgi:Mg2+/citrate symporter
MADAQPIHPNVHRRRIVAGFLVLSSIGLVALMPWAGPLVGVGLLSWGLTAMRKNDDKILRAFAIAAACVGGLLILITLSTLLTQFRVR